MAELVFFPEPMIQLQQEVLRHPKLLERLKSIAGHDFEMKLAMCAAYVEIILDGMYDQEGLLKLCDIIVQRLKKKPVDADFLIVQH